MSGHSGSLPNLPGSCRRRRDTAHQSSGGGGRAVAAPRAARRSSSSSGVKVSAAPAPAGPRRGALVAKVLGTSTRRSRSSANGGRSTGAGTTAPSRCRAPSLREHHARSGRGRCGAEPHPAGTARPPRRPGAATARPPPPLLWCAVSRRRRQLPGKLGSDPECPLMAGQRQIPSQSERPQIRQKQTAGPQTRNCCCWGEITRPTD